MIKTRGIGDEPCGSVLNPLQLDNRDLQIRERERVRLRVFTARSLVPRDGVAVVASEHNVSDILCIGDYEFHSRDPQS